MRELELETVNISLTYGGVNTNPHISPDGIMYLKEHGAVLLGQTATYLGGLKRFLSGFGPDAGDFPEYLNDKFPIDHGALLSKFAGQLCYMALGKGRTMNERAPEYFDNIKKQGHGSVVEHPVYTVLLYGIDRAVTHELVRHRVGKAYCLSGDTLIYSEKMANGYRQGGTKRPLRDIFDMTKTSHGRSRLKLMRLRVMDESTRNFVTGRIKSVVESGTKPVFRVELSDGKNITCTKEHRFFTENGVEALEDIVGGLSVSANGKMAVHGPLRTPIFVNGQAPYKDASWLREQYVAKGLEQSVIGELVGVSEHCIRSWVRKHGLQKPMGSWSQGKPPWNKGRNYSTGKTHSELTKSIFRLQKMGKGNPQWKGGITKERQKIAADVLLLRTEIFTRDFYACRLCNTRGGELVLHHILPVWSRPDLARDKANIATVCGTCHTQRLNNHELDYVEVLGRSLAELGPTPRKVGRPPTLRAKLMNIVKVTYAGMQETYDIEMEGANHNFVANGIVTHNSQVSQRYVGPELLRYVMGPDLDTDRGRPMFFRQIRDNRQAYIERIEYLLDTVPSIEGEKKTDKRKRVQSFARRALANEVEAPIVMSGNIRSWRHVLTMRASGAADAAIRNPIFDCYRILKTVSPIGFNDFTESQLPDGTMSLTPAHKKI